MRATALLGTGAVLMLGVAACGSARHAASLRQMPLASFVLKVSEAPPGTRLVPQLSGPGTLERQGLTKQALQELGSFGFESDYGRQFYATNPRKGLVSVGSIAARFRNPQGASKGLRVLEQELRKVHPLAKPVSVSALGDEAWAYGGRFFSNAPATYRSFYFAWRKDNLIFTVAMSGPKSSVTAHATRALADGIAGRARENIKRSTAA